MRKRKGDKVYHLQVLEISRHAWGPHSEVWRWWWERVWVHMRAWGSALLGSGVEA